MQNKSVVRSQRERIGGEFVQFGLAKTNRRLQLATRLLLAQNISDVIGANGTSGVGLLDCAGNGFRAVVANQVKQLVHLPDEGAIGSGKFPQIRFGDGPEQEHQPLLRRRALRGRHLRVEFFLEALRAEGLAALPAAPVADNLMRLVVN